MTINSPSSCRLKIYAAMLAFALLTLPAASPACPLMTAWVASHGGAIEGVWFNQEKDAKIQIYGCGNKFCGSIVWVKEPKLDRKNPDPALRNRPVLGLQIMQGFTYQGNKQWTGGKIYDPKSGNTYSGMIRLADSGRLRLRGYVLFSLFGRTATWTRAPEACDKQKDTKK
ncbi:MAG: DUF2147 domain-containing protein [Actinomycetota bacterium]|nr:DUF2147 domain-containing protein [Actinomycetota bacterium]